MEEIGTKGAIIAAWNTTVIFSFAGYPGIDEKQGLLLNFTIADHKYNFIKAGPHIGNVFYRVTGL